MTDQQTNILGDIPPETKEQIQRVIEKVGESINREQTHVALSALICLISGAICGTVFDESQKKAAALLLLSAAVQVSIQAGVTDTEITSAMVQPGFYGGNEAQQ